MFLKNSQNSQKTPVPESLTYFNRVAASRPATLFKYVNFVNFENCVNFAKYLKAPNLQNASERLLLKDVS